MAIRGWLAASVALLGCGQQVEPEQIASFPVLTGEYLGQQPPGIEAELFAPGIVSTGMYTRDVAMTPDGTEMFFGVSVGGLTVIMQTKVEDGRWTRPEVAPFSANPDYMSLEPFVSPDGRKLYFLSNRPRDGGVMSPESIGAWVNQDIWVVDRTADGWSEPYNLGPPVNSADEEYFPSVTRDGTIYFTRTPSGTRESYIYRSRLVDGQYTEPERLGPEVNSTASQFNAFVVPDESYLILSVFGREDSMGSMDYYIVFRSEDDEWSRPINLGEEVNTARGGEFSPYVSPDGKYFFFMSTRSRPAESMPEQLSLDFLQEVFDGPQNGNSDIYWIEAGFIEDLRRAAAEESTE